MSRAQRRNEMRLKNASAALKSGAEKLELLRTLLLQVDDALLRSDADDSAKNLCSVCISSAREIAVTMRSEASKANWEQSSKLFIAAKGVAVLSSYVAVGAATGGSDALVSDQLRSKLESTCREIESSVGATAHDAVTNGAIHFRSSELTNDRGDLAVLRVHSAFVASGLFNGFTMHPAPDIASMEYILEELNDDDILSELNENQRSLLRTLTSSWHSNHSLMVESASSRLIRSLEGDVRAPDLSDRTLQIIQNTPKHVSVPIDALVRNFRKLATEPKPATERIEASLAAVEGQIDDIEDWARDDLGNWSMRDVLPVYDYTAAVREEMRSLLDEWS